MRNKRFKQGAASFYVIAFSTLVLMIVVASFTALVVAQITRSSNDDLAQSAYDSALAGVEDAKLAFYNYQACLAQGVKTGSVPVKGQKNLSCENIVWLMENSNEKSGYNTLRDNNIDPCDVVPMILGRDITENGVAINEGSENNMQQYYTCVQINAVLPDYRGTLSAANPMKAIRPTFAGASAGDIETIRVSWGLLDYAQKKPWQESSQKIDFQNTGNGDANPPAIAFALVQASGKNGGFKMEDFMKAEDKDKDYKTNRGMVYLIPSNNGFTDLGAGVFVKSNNKIPKNEPYTVACKGVNGYECSVLLTLPKTADGDGERGADNFIVATMLAYGASTDFALEFFCGNDTPCGSVTEDVGEDEEVDAGRASLSGVQISVDSTGRANDLFRRVEARLEGSDSFAMSIMGPLELTGGDSGSSDNNAALKKDLTVNCEYNFGPVTGSFCTQPTQE